MRSFKLNSVGLICVGLIVLSACTSEPVTTNFLGVKNDVVQFELINNQSEPIQNISIEVTSLDIQGEVLSVDTVNYNSATRNGKDGPFLNAKEESMFATSAPEGTNRSTARVLKYNY